MVQGSRQTSPPAAADWNMEYAAALVFPSHSRTCPSSWKRRSTRKFGEPCWTPLGSPNEICHPQAAWVATESVRLGIVKASTKNGVGGHQETSTRISLRGASWCRTTPWDG